jgi:hypothetical protein
LPHMSSKASTGPSTAPSIIEPSIAGSIYRGIDLDGLLPTDSLPNKDVGTLLRRTQSTSVLQTFPVRQRAESWWPRHLSFSLAEESILTWEDVTSSKDDTSLSVGSDPKKSLIKELGLAEESREIRRRLAAISFGLAQETAAGVRKIANLEKRAELDQHELDSLYYPSLEAFQGLQEMAHETIEGETARLRDRLRELEALGARLEYEINALRSKVEDVEDGIGELERQVEDVEERAQDLEEESKAGLSWRTRIFGLLLGKRTQQSADTGEYHDD